MKRPAKKRPPKVPPEQSKINSPALRHMRAVAYAPIQERKEDGGQEAIDAAEAKRKRKMERNRGQA